MFDPDKPLVDPCGRCVALPSGYDRQDYRDDVRDDRQDDYDDRYDRWDNWGIGAAVVVGAAIVGSAITTAAY